MDRRMLLTWVAVAAVAAAAGCGSESPSSPSAGGRGVELQGLVLGEGAEVAASSTAHAAGAKPQKITVAVEGTTLTAEVSANGTFVLKGIPAGTFTLVFTIEGREIGRVVVSAADGDEVKVVVQVKDGALVLVDMRIESHAPGASPSPTSCMISGGRVSDRIELEGKVQSGDADLFTMTTDGGRASGDVTVNASSAEFRCVGGAKPETGADCEGQLKGGAKVHVRGTLISCDAAQAQVTATEVKIQKTS